MILNHFYKTNQQNTFLFPIFIDFLLNIIEENCNLSMNNHKPILSQFSKLQKIGSGLTSTVYKATHKQLGEVCLKIIDNKFYSKPIGKLLIDNQIQLLSQINHNNLLKLLKYQQTPQQNVIITDFCQGGNLYQLTKKCKKFTEKQTLIIVQAIVNGLNYLYSNNIIHRDLKPQNVFFKKGQPIIADFGFAVKLNNQSLKKVNAGSPLYMAPQALQNLDFSIDSQVFSIGVIIYEMLTGKTPWTAESEKQLLQNMLTVKPTIQLINKQLQNLIKKCLEPNKQKRAKFNEIVSFFNAWKQQYFNQNELFKDVTNVKKSQDKLKSLTSMPITLSKVLTKNSKVLGKDQIKQVKKMSKDIKKVSRQKQIKGLSKQKQVKGLSRQKQFKVQQKENKKTKLFKLNIKPSTHVDKENASSHNRTFSSMKTNRIQSSNSCYNNKSIILQKIADGAKTKRVHNVNLNKTQKSKTSQNMHLLLPVLKRLDPQQMRFLPLSMIQKFKYIINSYLRIIQINQPLEYKDIPKGLINDQMSIQISKCKNEKQLCQSIQNYIGRMYRLAKNYKIQKQFIKDIQLITKRVQLFCA